MRAATITHHGSPPVVGDCPDPVPPPGTVLVAVTAAPITPLDVLCATGTSYFGPPSLPYVPGVQGVGVVADGALKGRPVWFPTVAGMQPGNGSIAQLAVASEAELVVLPDDAEDTVVAALGLSAVAAWMALTRRAQLVAGEQVLVLGAGGVVGQVAVQAARRLGARRVVAACRSAAAQLRARECGADAVVALFDGEDEPSLRARLAEVCDGPLDVVIDPLFGVPASASARLLGEHGRLVNLGSSAGGTAVFDSAHLRSHSAAILGYTNNDISAEERRQALLSVLRLAAQNGLTVAHEVVSLDEVGPAWAKQARGSVKRRSVVRIG